MAIIHFSRREVEARVVYWGPALSGKTTSLRALHAFTPPGRGGQLETLDTVDERTLFFDYLPLVWGTIAGFQGRVKVLGVPGQPLYRQTRRMLLRGADAVVFVADSGAQRLAANVESLGELQQALGEIGRSLDELPMVLQYNKRDLPDALTLKVLQVGLNARDLPWFESVATEGTGVVDAFQVLFALLSGRIERELASGGTELLRGSGGGAPLTDQEEVQRTLGEIIAVRSAEDGAVPAEAPAAPPEVEPPGPAPEEPSPPAVEPGAGEPGSEAEGLPFDLGAETRDAGHPSAEEGGLAGDAGSDPDQRTDPRAVEEEAAPAALGPIQAAAESPPPSGAVDEPPPPARGDAGGLEERTAPDTVLTLPCLPRPLVGLELQALGDTTLEGDGAVVVRLTLREPDSGRRRGLRVRLIPEAIEPPRPPTAPEPPRPDEPRALMMFLAALAGALLAFGACWVFLHP